MIHMLKALSEVPTTTGDDNVAGVPHLRTMPPGHEESYYNFQKKQHSLKKR